MTKPIFTNKGEIEAALGQVRGVVGGMQENLQSLQGLKQMLLEEFKGSGASGYESVANQLESRVNSYAASLGDLNKATDHAASLIGDADTRVAAMFQNLL
ncbi:WXG100 family type VII secretion target [Nocardia sp. NPDC003963]